MRKLTLLTAAAVAGATFSSQAVMAYQAGDIYLRAGFDKADVVTDNFSDERGFSLAGGYLFHDNFGVELGLGEPVDHDFGLAGNDLGSVDRMPVNLLMNYYPLGGIADARVQPFVGLGVNYSRYSSLDEVDPYNLEIDDEYGVMGQIGVDLSLSDHISATGYASYADIDAEVENNGESIGEVKLDPVTIGAGVTFRF
ncbi:OmpW/AlkL family protein [Halomonas sp.]|uniref:OmpW/AlkL family protein n=1 Tax=Halomonas sp. TaxID=1486246 RepID=UPI00298EBEFE|nr:OmpW family outer membrane protein [Halomonas sp.]MDW7748429.1 OmpW family outer membrane protein [Halomonas sp.]